MKKILILGASDDQIRLIKTAKDLGYFIVDCDFTTTNPGLPLVDRHYQIDYRSKERVLDVAKKENIQGVISNSEQAMPTVAYVAESLGLVGNSLDSILSLSDKTRFRLLQKDSGLFSPQHYEVENVKEALQKISTMNLPVLIKPCECSASRGLFKIDNIDQEYIQEAFSESKKKSWNSKVAIEEYVAMPSMTTYEGDVFICEDIFMWEGLFYTQRSPSAPMIPMTYSGPLNESDPHKKTIIEVLKRLFKEAGIRHGQYNVELYFTGNNKPFIIEINTRQGGRNIPEFIYEYSGVDLTELLVSTCMGDMNFINNYVEDSHKFHYISHHLVFPHHEGRFCDFHIDDEILPYLKCQNINCNEGELLHRSENGTDIIGYVDFEFPNKEVRNKYAFNIEDHAYIRYLN